MQRLEGDVAGDAPAGDDVLGVDLALDQLFAFAEELAGEDGDGSGSVPDFFVLGFADFDQDFGSRVFDVHGFEDCRAIVGNGDVRHFGAGSSRFEDFVLGVGGGVTIPLGPRVVLTRSATAMAPTKLC